MKPRRKPGATAAGRPQTTAFDLKQRLLVSLNKLADRDTQLIGADELDRAAETLTPDTILPFLSCVADTDSDQKPAVRRECVRVMGTLARLHGSLLYPHLSKVMASIVKRLKDADSAVRDACVEAVGVMAGGDGDFVALVRPLFEAIGEQNRYAQAGAALCLARVIGEAVDPNDRVLLQILGRAVKLLKNQNFMAKPAVIELIRSIVQAGGASTEHALTAAVTSILEELKSNDWTTRRAASVALSDIAASAGTSLGRFRTRCLRNLEGCRFDKVKPVRDAVLHAIQCWKKLPGTDSPELSEVGSSTKENFGGDCSDVISADGGWRDTSSRKVGPVSALSSSSANSTEERIPLTVRRSPTFVNSHQHVRPNDWPIEIALPKTQTMPSVDSHCEESGGSCVAKIIERETDTTRRQTMKYDYDPTDDKPECYSMSDLISGSFETKHVTVAHCHPEEQDSANFIRKNHLSEVDPEGLKLQNRKSLDSTITDSCSGEMHECCLYTAKELSFIRKQLMEIEIRQSDLMELLQVFAENSMDGLSKSQLKVHNLEHTVDKIAKVITQNEDYSNIPITEFMKKNVNVSSSSRLSTSTPRPSVDSTDMQPSLLSMTVENASSRGRSSKYAKDGLERWRNSVGKAAQKNSERCIQRSGSSQTRVKKDAISLSACNASVKQDSMKGKASFWKWIKESLSAGDIESAYVKVLSAGEGFSLIELMDRTGPVLEKLSYDTATEVLSTLASRFLNNRCLDSIIPWLQQVVVLSSGHEPRHFSLSAKERLGFLVAIDKVAAVEFTDPAERASIAKLTADLGQVWGRVLMQEHASNLCNTRQTAVC